MYKVELKPYCDSCPYFEPDTIKPELCTGYINNFDGTVTVEHFVEPIDTIVRCKHGDTCAIVERYFQCANTIERKSNV